jgi:uncharacterized repeat protein (TIGR03803 family)
MQSKKLFTGLTAVLAIFTGALLLSSTRAAAQQEKVLHSFSSTDKVGFYPAAPLIFDADGNLYGTTCLGGAYNGGTVFELMPAAGGHWISKVLHEFGNGTDGSCPYSTLIFDALRNLYGTTTSGGIYGGQGTAFELSPQAGGTWNETILHNFSKNGTDGYNPAAGLAFDASGNLYGTTDLGGANNYGVVFELSPATGGTWTETVLHSFGSGEDALAPYLGTLVFDAAGNFYGATEYGGVYQNGALFEMSPAGGGAWTEKVVFSFNPDSMEGFSPSSGVIFDTSGNLYGTAYFGGAYKVGTVFELSPAAGGVWTEKVLYAFKNNNIDGRNPAANLIFDAAGNLYGTTSSGGAYGYGTAFELTPKGGGGWKEKQLHTFNLNGSDGFYPFVPLTLDAAGNLYGTTLGGGANDDGTVFEIKP